MNSSARTIANHANAQLSTGPKTEAGKAASSRNALTTALTGRTVVLPSENQALYERHLAAYCDRFRPANLAESTLVQAIADSDWRLGRIPFLMMELECRAQQQLTAEGTEQYKNLDEATLQLNIGVESFLRCEKQIRNLYLQESRLHRRREKDLAELQALQSARKAREANELKMATELYLASEENGEIFDPAEFGFEFSIELLKREVARRKATARPKSTLDYSLGATLGLAS